MLQPQSIPVIQSATTTNATSYVYTSTGVFTDTQTIVIAGVTLTSVTSIGAAAGNFLIGGSAAISLTNLAALINNPSVTSANQVALSAANQLIFLKNGVSAVATATTLTVTTTNGSRIVVSETQTNGSFSSVYTSAGFSYQLYGKGSLQFVATAITSGNSVFTVQVSNDGANWTSTNRLTTDVTNTNAQTDTRVASVTLNSNGSSIVTLPDPYAYFRVIATITTDGTYSATAYMM